MMNIWKEHRTLEKERRDLIKDLMMPHEEYFRSKRKALMEACELEGHNFKFSHLGPLSNPWFYCTKCGKSKVEDND